MDGGQQGAEPVAQSGTGSPLEVLAATLRLGLTSFGGPIAHLGYFHDEYVVRRRWLDEQTYADLVALCQFLPGPASSEVGIAVGIQRAGLLGGLCAWIGFTLPSAVALVVFAALSHGVANAPWIHGLQFVAVAVVAQAVWQLWQRLAPDRTRATLAVAGAIAVLAWRSPVSQILVIAAASVIGWRFLPAGSMPSLAPTPSRIRRPVAVSAWVILIVLLLGLPLVAQATHSHTVAVANAFFRTGSLVFGGGHVVLPLLQEAVVAPGWVGQQRFLTGYGAAQAVPGPLFTFSAYLGYALRDQPNGIPGAALALASIFLPAFLLVTGMLPFWDWLRTRPQFRAALAGINAAVVGILLAALYNPIWVTAIKSWQDLSIALIAFVLLAWWHTPPWIVVLVTVAISIAAGAIGAIP